MIGPYCTICRSAYRGIYPIHAATEKHRRRAYGRGRAKHSDLKRTLGIASLNVKRALAGDSGADRDRVRAHRRRLPDDGPRMVVPVRRYFRSRAWRPGGFLWRA